MACTENENKNRKKKKVGKDGDAEKAVAEWFKTLREEDVRVNGINEIKNLKSWPDEWGEGKFFCDKWLVLSMAKRQNFTCRKLHREAREADASATDV